jgi:nitrite reductase (NADH) large subunit
LRPFIMKQRIVIIGNSAAGIGALEAIRKYDRLSSVTLVSAEDERVYSRCLLSYFLSGTLGEEGLLFRPPDFCRRMEAEILPRRKVESVNPAGQQVVCYDGAKLDFDKLLIATGGSPTLPPQIPRKTAGVFVLRTVADAMAIRSWLEGARNAVVLGGGLVGMKAAFALHKRGLRVTVVVRSPHVLSQMLDAGAAELVMDRLREDGIEVLTGADVAGIELHEGKVAAVKVTEEGASAGSRPCELLIVAKGVAANKELVRGTAVQHLTGIITDAHMQTSVENIYAAGDVAETFDVALEARSVNALWTCAMQQGRIAGLNMAGQTREYDGSVGLNSLNFPGVDLISFGVVQPAPEAGYEVLVEQRPAEGVYKKLVLKGDRIKGLVLVNRIDNAGVLLSLLGRKVDVADFKDDLLSDRFSYATVLLKGGPEELRRYAQTPKAACVT